MLYGQFWVFQCFVFINAFFAIWEIVIMSQNIFSGWNICILRLQTSTGYISWNFFLNFCETKTGFYKIVKIYNQSINWVEMVSASQNISYQPLQFQDNNLQVIFKVSKFSTFQTCLRRQKVTFFLENIWPLLP